MLALAVVAFVACDDDDEGLNGWTDTAYVYVQGETLGNDMLKQAVVIETEGLEDATPCVYTFRACINKPAKADATVSLTAAASGGIADMLENTMTLSAESLTIPAGQLASEEATLTIDPAFLAITDEQKTYDPAVFTVTVGELKTSCNDVRLSTKTNKVTVTYKKDGQALSESCERNSEQCRIYGPYQLERYAGRRRRKCDWEYIRR